MEQSKKQLINDKRRKMCEDIIGKPVAAAFMNGGLPHYVALAWTGKNSAYFVHLKKKTCKEYLKDGKFLMRRAMVPVISKSEMRPPHGVFELGPRQLSFIDTKFGLRSITDVRDIT